MEHALVVDRGELERQVFSKFEITEPGTYTIHWEISPHCRMPTGLSVSVLDIPGYGLAISRSWNPNTELQKLLTVTTFTLVYEAKIACNVDHANDNDGPAPRVRRVLYSPKKFKVGRYYRHKTGHVVHTLMKADKRIWGDSLIVERMYIWGTKPQLSSLLVSSDSVSNYIEITKEEWDNKLNLPDSRLL